jgi:hypothetical protein
MISMKPIALVRNERREVEDDDWGAIASEIVMEPEYGAAPPKAS